MKSAFWAVLEIWTTAATPMSPRMTPMITAIDGRARRGRRDTSPGGSGAIAMALGQSYWWYDFSVTIAGAEGFLRRFAGRVETGKSGFSDPVMGRVRL